MKSVLAFASILATASADVVKTGPSELIFNGQSFVYMAPHDTSGSANIPFTNATVIAVAEKFDQMPSGYSQININSTLPKYLVRSHPGEDQVNLKAAYSEDVIQVGPEHFILATDEVMERKAHSCGSLVLNPVTGLDVRRSEMVIPKVSPTTSQNDLKSDYMSKLTSNDMQQVLEQLSGEQSIQVDGTTTKLLTRYSFVDQNRQAAEWAGAWFLENSVCDDLIYQVWQIVFFFFNI